MEYVNQNPGQARTIGQLFGRVKITEPTVEVVSNSEKEGTLVVSPLMKGYGTTVGNALRRVMLSSLPGAAAVSIKISSGGVQALHEISSLPDVKEDVCEIVLNVKAIIARPTKNILIFFMIKIF